MRCKGRWSLPPPPRGKDGATSTAHRWSNRLDCSVIDTRRIDPERLALWFAWPAILGEFGPSSPTGYEYPLALQLPQQDRQLDDYPAELDRELLSVAAEHKRIAVLMSGGLDSAAILHRLVRLVGPGRVVAVTTDLTDDRGLSSAGIAARLTEAVGPSVELVVAEPDPRTPARWSPVAPRLDAAPQHNDALLLTAARAGSTVALTGNGGDEVFGTPRFLSGHLAAAGQFRKLLSYAGDTLFYSLEAAWKEPLSVLGDRLPRRPMVAIYNRVAWQELNRSTPAALAERWHPVVTEWSREWQHRLASVETALGSWAHLDAWGNVFPLAPLTAGLEDIEVRSPFHAPNVLRAALEKPVCDRYDHRWPYAYWRAKAGVVGLFDPSLLDRLPTAKQTFKATLTAGHRLKGEPTALIEAGVLRPGRRSNDELFDRRVAVVESWLREALRRGYTLA